MEGLGRVFCGGYFAVLVGVVGVIGVLDIEQEGQGRDGSHCVAFGMVLWRLGAHRSVCTAEMHAQITIESVASIYTTLFILRSPDVVPNIFAIATAQIIFTATLCWMACSGDSSSKFFG